MELFPGNERGHGTHGMPVLDEQKQKWTIKNTAKYCSGPPTLDAWRAHVHGKRPLGIVPIRDDSTCSFGGIDIDEYDVDLASILKMVERRKFPLLPVQSKSGGLHLFLLLSEPIAAAEMR